MLKKLTTFQGRISRLNYAITLLVLLSILGAVMYLLFSFLVAIVGGAIFLVLFLILFILYWWILLAQGAKRCHDLGKSGWYQLIPFYVFWMLFKPGNAGNNHFGPDPNIETRKMDDILDSSDSL